MVRLGTTKENWTTRDGDQGWAGWKTIRGFTGWTNWNQPLKWRETASIQGRVGSRPNGGIWRDDLDQLGQLLCWIVAEVSNGAHLFVKELISVQNQDDMDES